MKKLVNSIKLFCMCKIAVVYMIMYIIANIGYIYIDTKMLIWISDCVSDYANWKFYIATIIVAVIIQTICSYAISYCSKMYMNKSFKYLNDLYAGKILDADYKMFVKYSTSKILTVNEATWNIASTVSLVARMGIYVVKIIAPIVAIISINYKFAIPVIIIYSASIPIIRYTFNKYDSIVGRIKKIKLSRNKELDQVINGFAEVRSFNTQTYHKNSIYNLNAGIEKGNRETAILNAQISSFFDCIAYAPSLITLVQICKCISKNVITVAEGIAVIMYIWRLLNPLVAILNSIDEFSNLTMYLDDFIEIINHENSKDGSIELKDFNSDISFNNVSFSYDDSDTVLNNINLKIKKGEKIGICGSSGGGKSTLLKLLPRFYDTYTGSIEIDGIDTKQLTANSLRSHISIVHQDNYILDGTIYDNIVYGNWNASEYDVIEACKKAAIYDFIQTLPEKFNTNVGPKGLKLSGGQKQRISLARVFLSNADIVLLDEATSALDNESENIIQDSLAMFKDKTIITIAHRLSTIKDFDKIVVVDNHTIAECGTHEELIARNGIYAKLYKA